MTKKTLLIFIAIPFLYIQTHAFMGTIITKFLIGHLLKSETTEVLNNSIIIKKYEEAQEYAEKQHEYAQQLYDGISWSDDASPEELTRKMEHWKAAHKHADAASLVANTLESMIKKDSASK